MLVQLADFLGASLTDVGLIPANDDADYLFDGFVFSLAGTRAIIQREQRLRLAIQCEKFGWDRGKININGLSDLPKAA